MIKPIHRILQMLAGILMPFIILMGGVRAIMTPAFAAGEYNRKNFPADAYGFMTEERLKWAGFAITYLTNNAEIDYLGDLRFASGGEVFNQSELEHMKDVKRVVQVATLAWYGALGLVLLSAVWLLIVKKRDLLRKGLNFGGWLTLGLISAVLIFLAVNFDSLFDNFHRLFFSEGTWLFYETDTLIRLFPIVFWRDAFILVLAFTLVMAVILISLTRKRRQLSPVQPSI